MTAQPSDGLDRLVQVVRGGRVLILTGAGISTDSGIPDYRGPTGRLRHSLPMTFDRFAGSTAEQRRYWARSHIGWGRIAQAQPNAAHLAVTQLQRLGLVSGVVTQNVDGLHRAAGTTDVIDLHGRLDQVVCLGCGVRRSRFEVGLRLDVVNPGFRDAVAADEQVVRPDGDLTLPDDLVEQFQLVACRHCGGPLKPDVVFFGEPVPRDRFGRALGQLSASRALLVLGSSLQVGSGYRFATAAARQGLPVVIVNRGVTRADHLATVRLDAPLGAVLPALVARIETVETVEGAVR